MNKIVRLFRYDWPLHLVLFFTNWLPDNVIFIRLRGRLARPFFKKCGKKLGIGRNVTFYNPSNIVIGDWVYMAYGCWFFSGEELTINDEVIFGPYVVISPSNHSRKNGSWRFGAHVVGKVSIEKGVWVGAHVSILSDVTIGEGAVIAAGTSVADSVPKHSLFAGEKGTIKKTYS